MTLLTRSGFAALALSLLAITPATAQLDSSATNAALVDYDTGEILFCKNCQEKMPPSSMSKLMTVELVLQRLKDGRLKLSDTFHVSETAWRQGQTTNESKMWVELNSDVSVENILKGIIVSSGGDACVVVAEALAGSEAAFSEMQNRRAAELGLTQSHFTNSSGLPDPNHYMSAADIATLTAHIIRAYPEYYPMFAIKDFSWSGINQPNRNRLLYMNIGADGVKTGHTEAGGYGISASSVRDGRRMIVVVNGLNSDAERTSEAARLLNLGFREFKSYALFKTNEEIGEAEVWGGVKKTVKLKAGEAVSATMTPETHKAMVVKYSYESPVPAPIEEGAAIGTLTIAVPGKPVRTVPLLAAEPVSSSGIVGNIVSGFRKLISGS